MKDLMDLFFEDKWMMAIGLGLILLLGIAVIGAWTEGKMCEDNGGKMEGTGKYTQQVMMAGDVPFIYETENRECSKK